MKSVATPVTVESLVKAGMLRRVTVTAPDAATVALGDAEVDVVFHEPGDEKPRWMALRLCAGNSLCLVRAKRRLGEETWAIVSGFAKQTPESLPIAHVWVSCGHVHFDPTLIRLKGFDIHRAEYYELADQIVCDLNRSPKDTERPLLKQLEELAEDWNLTLAPR